MLTDLLFGVLMVCFGDFVFIFLGLKGPSLWCALVMEKTHDASECIPSK